MHSCMYYGHWVIYAGDDMLSDGQSRKIAKFRKLAKKNTFCRYFATVLIVVNVIVSKFFSFHKRRLIVMGQLCLVMLVFLSNTSFAPPTFAYASVNAPIEDNEKAVVTDDIEVEAFEDEELMKQIEDEHASVNTEDVANLDDLIEKSKETAVESDNAATSTTQTDSVNRAEDTNVHRVTFDKNDWKLLLINKQHTIPEDYEFTLGTIKGSMRCDERIIEPLTQMFAAAKEDGVNLIVCSPYRDMARQEYLFDRKVKNYQSTGMSYMDAYKKASITVTLPGASEHQVGLAVDIISDTYTSLEIGFAETEAGKWLAEHSWEYGFILRYPLGKEEITGIQFEPWHFRYVGVDAAEVITSQNITLEEFIENL